MKTTRAHLTTALLVLLVSSTSLLAGWDEGVAAFNAGRYQEAVTEFRDVVERSPDAAAGHYMLGMTLLRQKQVPASLESLGRAVDLAPDDARYRLALGQAQLQGKVPEDALATLAALDPESVDESAREVYGQLLAGAASRSRQHGAAHAALAKALAVDGGSSPLGLALANVLRDLDRIQEALAVLLAVSEFDRAFKGAMVMAQEEEGEAAIWHARAFEIARQWAEAEAESRAHLMAGEAQIALGDYAAARTWFAGAAAADKSDPEPHFKQADCALALGLAEETLTHVRTALTLGPDEELRRKLFEKRAAAYRHLKKFGKAAESFRRAGNVEKASEMDGFARDQENNAKELAKCKQRVADIEKLKREHEDLEGTDAWAQLEQDHTAVLESCAEYLQES